MHWCCLSVHRAPRQRLLLRFWSHLPTVSPDPPPPRGLWNGSLTQLSCVLRRPRPLPNIKSRFLLVKQWNYSFFSRSLSFSTLSQAAREKTARHPPRWRSRDCCWTKGRSDLCPGRTCERACLRKSIMLNSWKWLSVMNSCRIMLPLNG